MQNQASKEMRMMHLEWLNILQYFYNSISFFIFRADVIYEKFLRRRPIR